MGIPCESSRPELSENVVLFIYIVCDVLENILLNGSVEKRYAFNNHILSEPMNQHVGPIGIS